MKDAEKFIQQIESVRQYMKSNRHCHRCMEDWDPSFKSGLVFTNHNNVTDEYEDILMLDLCPDCYEREKVDPQITKKMNKI